MPVNLLPEFTSAASTPGSGSPVTRREFLELAAATTLLADFSARAGAAEGASESSAAHLGRTGERVSCIGLAAITSGYQSTEEESIRIIRSALDNGMNFLDNCWDYNDGASEVRMGKALRDGYRAKAFLMTKIDGQTKEAATQQLEESLRRLQTDHIDLLQFHEVIRMTDPDRIFAPGGGMEAVVAAQEGGQGPLYRFHRAQEPGHAFENAGDGVGAPFSFRRGADAAQRDGRASRKF